ncbi:Homeobox protein TOS8 [Spathaspora sp. JA1]|nr:Homeobox protein TOS8 [Spathaspora sp. JA1]
MHLNQIVNDIPSPPRPVVLPTVLPSSKICLPPISDILAISQLPPVSALQQQTQVSYQPKPSQPPQLAPPPPPPTKYSLPSLAQQQPLGTTSNSNYKYYYDYYPSDTSNLERSPISQNSSPIFYTTSSAGTVGVTSIQVQPIIRHNSYPCKDSHRRHDDSSEDGSLSPPAMKRKTRNNLPKEITFILLKWLNDHLNHPYPNSFEKNQLMMATGLNQQQLSNWFINARRRKIKSLKEQKRLSLG